MIYMGITFTANMRFGYLPSEDEIVNYGYIPLYEILAKFPQFKANLCFSGYSELTLAKKYPKVVDMVKKGISEGRFRISSNGFEHIPMPFVSYECTNKNILKGIETDQKVWSIKQPDGFVPSDGSWDPTIGLLAHKAGLKWVMCHRNYVTKEKLEEYKDIDPYHPVYAICPENTRVMVPLAHNRCAVLVLREKDMDDWFNELKAISASRKDDVFMCATLDMEMPLAIKVQGYAENGIERFQRFIEKWTQMQGIEFTFIGDYLEKHPPKQEAYLKHSYWHWYGDGWCKSDGAEKLVSICSSAERNILDCENLISAGYNAPEVRFELEQAWEHLLFALNSEAYFTDNLSGKNDGIKYPLARVNIDAYDNALKANELSKQIKIKLQFKLI